MIISSKMQPKKKINFPHLALSSTRRQTLEESPSMEMTLKTGISKTPSLRFAMKNSWYKKNTRIRHHLKRSNRISASTRFTNIPRLDTQLSMMMTAPTNRRRLFFKKSLPSAPRAKESKRDNSSRLKLPRKPRNLSLRQIYPLNAHTAKKPSPNPNAQVATSVRPIPTLAPSTSTKSRSERLEHAKEKFLKWSRNSSFVTIQTSIFLRTDIKSTRCARLSRKFRKRIVK